MSSSPDAELLRRVRTRRAGGDTYAEVGAAVGVSAQHAWQLIHSNGGDPCAPGADGRFAAKWGSAVAARFEDLLDPKAVAATLALPERSVRRYLARVDLLHLALPAGTERLEARRWGPEGILDAIRAAEAATGTQLTLSRYETWLRVKGNHGPSYRTVIVHFGSWAEACSAAGVVPGEASRTYTSAIEEVACRQAVGDYVAECVRTGRRPTLTGYEAVSPERRWPCRNTVLLRLSGYGEARASWRQLVRDALDGPGQSRRPGPGDAPGV